MPITIATLKTDISSFLDNSIINQVATLALPIVDKIADLPQGNGALQAFTEIKIKILSALDAAPDTSIDAIILAINNLAITGISAAKDAAETGIDLTLAKSVTVSTSPVNIDIGKEIADVFTFEADVAAGIKADLNLVLNINENGELSIQNNATPELTISVEGDIANLKAGAELGIVDVILTDGDPTLKELDANVEFNLVTDTTTGDISVDTKFGGNVGIDLNFATSNTLLGLFPDIGGHFKVDFPLDPGTLAQPTVKFENVTLDLKSYMNIAGANFSEIGDLFNSGALGAIVDASVDPFPGLDAVINYLPGPVRAAALAAFDTVGSFSGGGDEVITALDLLVDWKPELKPTIDVWYKAIVIIDAIRKLSAAGADGKIAIGSSTITDIASGTQDKSLIVDPAKILDDLETLATTALNDLGLPPELKNAALDMLNGVTKGLSGGATGGGTASSGFSFDLLEHPEKIFEALFTKPVGENYIDVIKYDIPSLVFEAKAQGFIPILGPIGIGFGGDFRGVLDANVGYDLKGVATGNFFDGFYLDTPVIGGVRQPVATIHTGVNAGVEANVRVARIGGGLEFTGDLEAFFRNPKFRPGTGDYNCIFDAKGALGYNVKLFIEVGAGPFSFDFDLPLAGGVLADFNGFKCPPPDIAHVPVVAEGLASPSGTDLLLNVGDRASFRKVIDEDTNSPTLVSAPDDPKTTTQNESLNEHYLIANARKEVDGAFKSTFGAVATEIVPGFLDIHAFGFTQRADIPKLIKADFKDGDDSLIIQNDVTVNSEIASGAGDDSLTGGAGIDNFNGESGRDSLVGGIGDDILIGGSGNDKLDGGKGADTLDGGDDIDSVDYSQSNRDIGTGVEIHQEELILGFYNSTGHGGDAEGDQLEAIEHITGTDYNDLIEVHIVADARLIGGYGNDVLISGDGNDLLIGGVGADKMVGGIGSDATTYATSWAGVDVDLERSVQRRGDAEGDVLESIEYVQGSGSNDVLYGDNSQNVLDGTAGNDSIDGRGGADDITGGSGDDWIYGHANGSKLDGGEGLGDLLSYVYHTGPVSIDLGNSEIGAGNFTNAPDNIVMDIKATATTRGYSTFEDLDGSDFSDNLTGDLYYNTIRGFDGADVISADGGNDRLIGGNGADALNGGDGFDWVEYGDSGAGVTVDLQSVGVGGTAQDDTYANVENILGSRFADRLLGDASDNIIDPNLSPGGALELIEGRGGTDRMVLNFSSPDIDVGTGVIGGFGAGVQNGVFIHSNAASATLHEITFFDVEAMDFTGTKSDDTVRAKSGNDNISTGSGADTIYSGTGADNVDAGRGTDTVYVGTDTNFALTDLTTSTPQLIDGGRGRDTLSISLAHATRDVVIAGYNGFGDFRGVNFTYDNGAAVKNFEIFKDVWTGSGDDEITQLGSINNDFRSGAGEDILRPGLGTDTVDGGLDLAGIAIPSFGISFDSFAISNVSDFNNARGDRLVLDYSSLTGDVAVFGGGSLHSTNMNIGATGALLRTNSGRYQAFANGNTVLTDEVSFDNIEGVTITGTSGNDFFSGTHAVFSAAFDPAGSIPEARGGDDVLAGGDGTDFLIGYSGDDTLKGDAGNDVLIGTEINTFDPFGGDGGSDQTLDDTELDELTGGSGADEFWLGDTVGAYYVGDTDEDGIGTYGKAIIADFNVGDGDIVQLFGDSSMYEARAGADGSTDIVMTTPPGQDGEFTIATLLNTAAFDLDEGYVRYLPGAVAAVAAISASITSPFASITPAIADLSLSAAPEFLIDSPLMRAAVADLAAPADLALPLVGPGWVTQDNDAADLKTMLDGASGALPGSTLELSGSAESFGTFDGDPFGLGTGVILSTGYVEDLPGANTSGGVTANSSPIPINFNLLGRTGNNDIFVADISDLNIDIRSISLTDSGSRIGGLGGLASGFDIGAIALSSNASRPNL